LAEIFNDVDIRMNFVIWTHRVHAFFRHWNCDRLNEQKQRYHDVYWVWWMKRLQIRTAIGTVRLNESRLYIGAFVCCSYTKCNPLVLWQQNNSIIRCSRQCCLRATASVERLVARSHRRRWHWCVSRLESCDGKERRDNIEMLRWAGQVGICTVRIDNCWRMLDVEHTICWFTVFRSFRQQIILSFARSFFAYWKPNDKTYQDIQWWFLSETCMRFVIRFLPLSRQRNLDEEGLHLQRGIGAVNYPNILTLLWLLNCSRYQYSFCTWCVNKFSVRLFYQKYHVISATFMTSPETLKS